MDSPERPSLPRRFVALAVPNVAASLLVPLTSLVDTALLGHLDDARHLAGVSLATVVFDLLYWTFGFLRMGTTGLSAQALGTRNRKESNRVLLRGTALGACIGLGLLFLNQPLGMLGFGILEGAADVKQAAWDYFDARIVAAPAALIGFAIQGWLIGQQRVRAVLGLSLVANLCNISLDYIFIHEWGMATAGAGHATALSQYLTLALGVWLVRDALGHWTSEWRGAMRGEDLRRFARLGRDILIRTFALLLAFALFKDFSAALGTDRLAGNSVLLQVVTLSAFFVDGYAYAVEAMAGELHGANKRRELWSLLGTAGAAGLLTSSIFACVFILAPETLLGLLTDLPGVLSMSAADRYWLAPLLLFGSLAYVLDGYFIGLSAGPVLARSMLWSLLLGFVPLAIWARLSHSPDLLWAALSSFMFARVLSLGLAVPRSVGTTPPS